ncbi:hypothetical protein [Maribacter halichondriae]|uniref:hypothetical protein n=1 Tax=Maribacter halichondriae TaxID=2980554 RepID=UPI002359E114|nr:hypothetical protein [Maribacter sp. Hal144]
MKWIKKLLIALVIVLFGFLLLHVSRILYELDSDFQWLQELAKGIMGLSFTAIFGGIIKLIFDKYQEDKKEAGKNQEI